MKTLPREFYLRDAREVAKDLLGKILVHRTKQGDLMVEITEVEAYLGIEDPACHSYGDRRTPRTQTMYGLGGHAYIYLIYGMHYLLNAVTGQEGDPCAVLIRAGTPLEGRELLSQNRYGKPYHELTKSQLRAFCDGPGKLSKALGLTIQQNGWDLCQSPLIITEGVREKRAIATGPRIGVDYAGEAATWPLNFRLVD
jgi:DNA-3-methyladenine glycosylase